MRCSTGEMSWNPAKMLRCYLLNREVAQLDLCFRKSLLQQLERSVSGGRAESCEQVIATGQVRRDKGCYEAVTEGGRAEKKISISEAAVRTLME